MNRLEDSFDLWKEVCSSKLLTKTQAILFLNKIDLLEKKLRAGVKFKQYVTSYGDRPNDLDSVTLCECLSVFHGCARLMKKWAHGCARPHTAFQGHLKEVLAFAPDVPRAYDIRGCAYLHNYPPILLGAHLRSQDTVATSITLSTGPSFSLSRFLGCANAFDSRRTDSARIPKKNQPPLISSVRGPHTQCLSSIYLIVPLLMISM